MFSVIEVARAVNADFDGSDEKGQFGAPLPNAVLTDASADWLAN